MRKDVQNGVVLDAIAGPREPPEPALDHLARLTDDTGLFQHAKFTIPNRAHGYCTDDNARGVVATVKYYSHLHDPQAMKLLDTYLAFLMYAQKPNGALRNFMDFNRRWCDDEPPHDGFGRAVWALGTVLANPPAPAYLAVVKDCFDRTTGHIQQQSARGLAYCIFGLCEYLKRFPGTPDIQHHIEQAADRLVRLYHGAHTAGWEWFEDFLTYDNAVLPHALFVAGRTLGRAEPIEVARRTADFLVEASSRDGHFSFVGTQGWYERGNTRACFDQQPVEAAAMVLMLQAAYEATRDSRYRALHTTAFDWFLGANDVGRPLYDPHTKGCADGLMSQGVNGNQGAESMVSYLLSRLSVLEIGLTAAPVSLANSTAAVSPHVYDGMAAGPAGVQPARTDAAGSYATQPT